MKTLVLLFCLFWAPAVVGSTTGQVQIVKIEYLPVWTNSAGQTLPAVKLVVNMNGRSSARLMIENDSGGYDYGPAGFVYKVEVERPSLYVAFYVSPSELRRRIAVHSPQ